MKQFRHGFIHHLKKKEFVALITEIIRITELRNVPDPSVRQAYERLAASEDKLYKMFTHPRKHPLTDETHKKVKERQLLLRSLQYSIKAKLHSAEPEERKAADELSFLFKPYAGKFYHPKLNEHSSSVSNLKAGIYGKENYLQQMEILQLVTQFELIMQLTDEIDKSLAIRLDDRAENKRLTKRVREEIYTDLQLLFSTLQIAAAFDSENKTYHKIILLISAILKERERVLHIRQGMRRGRKAREEKEE